MIIAAADLLIFLALTFVGDHSIGAFPSFLIVWIVLLIYRLITGLEISKEELKLQQIVFIIFSPYLILGAFQLDPYYFGFLQIVLYINVFQVLFRFLACRNAANVILYFFVFLTSVVILFGGGARLSSNEVFIFGPNIMYRIYGLLFFAFYYAVIMKTERKGSSLLIVFLMSFVCLISTGSRGGTLILLMEMIAVAIYFRKNTIVKYFVYALISVFFYYIIQYWELISELLGRSVFIDVTSASENTRLSMLDGFIKFLQTEPMGTLLFGLGNNNHYYPNYYPHNIIIESIVYHGLFFLTFMIIAATSFIKKLLIKRNEMRVLLLIFSPIFIGAMVSGYLLDNFTIISLVFYAYLGSMNVNNFKNLATTVTYKE